MSAHIMEISTTVSTGQVTLSFPSRMTEADFDEMREWFEYVNKKLDRMQKEARERAAPPPAPDVPPILQAVPVEATSDSAPKETTVLAWSKKKEPER